MLKAIEGVCTEIYNMELDVKIRDMEMLSI